MRRARPGPRGEKRAKLCELPKPTAYAVSTLESDFATVLPVSARQMRWN